MQLRDVISTLFAELGHILRDDRTARMAALSGLAVLLLMSLVTVIVARRGRRAGPHLPDDAHITLDAGPEFAPRDFGDWGGLPQAKRAAPSPAASDAGWPIDAVLPRRVTWTIVLAALIGVAAWLAGLALTPAIKPFLASAEWQMQPFYLASHIIALRLFVLAYTRGFERGVAYLTVPPSQLRTLVNQVLSFPGAIVALIVALPFATLDFLFLFSPEYERLGGGDAVLLVDYLMWAIWSVEWFFNAFIWVVVLGFLIKSWWVIRTYHFRAPIEIVLHDRHYKPFLQMSAQGASVVLVFTIVTVLYIWYTGGELTDYIGLGITASMLIVGFVPSWLLLKSKVKRAVEQETLAMRRGLLANLALAEQDDVATGRGNSIPGHSPIGASTTSLEHRLDAAVAILRISYLENRNQNLGQTEARAIMVRLLAPAASVIWQLAKSQGSLVADLQRYMGKLF